MEKPGFCAGLGPPRFRGTLLGVPIRSIVVFEVYTGVLVFLAAIQICIYIYIYIYLYPYAHMYSITMCVFEAAK